MLPIWADLARAYTFRVVCVKMIRSVVTGQDTVVIKRFCSITIENNHNLSYDWTPTVNIAGLINSFIVRVQGDNVA